MAGRGGRHWTLTDTTIHFAVFDFDERVDKAKTAHYSYPWFSDTVMSWLNKIQFSKQFIIPSTVKNISTFMFVLT